MESKPWKYLTGFARLKVFYLSLLGKINNHYEEMSYNFSYMEFFKDEIFITYEDICKDNVHYFVILVNLGET